MAREELRGDTKYVKEAAYEYETYVDEVIGTVIHRRKSYSIAFQIGYIISHKYIK